MFVLYVDESGNYDDPNDHFVVGGLAVHESDLTKLRVRLNRVVAKHLDPHLRGQELHANPIRTGKKTWRGVPRATREALVNDICRLLGTYGSRSKAPFALFGVVRSPGAVPHADPLERCFEELFLRYTQMLIRLDPNSDAPRGIVVADKARYESTLQPITSMWREQGTRFRKLSRLAEVPLFVDSKATPFIQLADFVAHAIYRQYHANDSTMFMPMLPGFDETDEIIHGLVHLVQKRRACSCIACASRRGSRRL